MITFALGLFLITLLSSISGSHQATCDENEFACSDGSCIDNFLVCDGEKNCPDGSDETKTVCSKIHVLCPTHAFRCAYGACIDGQKKCDGKQDCADNSDEKPAECGSVPPSDNSSSNANICPVRSFTCDSKQCINEYLVCDGEDNCRDGSDETESRCVNFPCPALVGFQCAYGGCIDKDRKCNGIKDCKDGSDENDQACATNTPPRPGDPGSPVRQEVINCIRKLWASLSKNIYKPLKAYDYFGKSDSMESSMLLLEQCFTIESPPQRLDESPDDIYGKYVATRMKAFEENEKVEIKHRIDKMLYFQFKKKGKGNNSAKNGVLQI